MINPMRGSDTGTNVISFMIADPWLIFLPLKSPISLSSRNALCLNSKDENTKGARRQRLITSTFGPWSC